MQNIDRKIPAKPIAKKLRLPLEPDFLETYDKPALAGELRRIAKLLGKSSLSMADIDAHGRVSSVHVIKKFRSLNAALLAARLNPTRNLATAELLRLLLELWERTLDDSGRSPRTFDCEEYNLPVKWTAFANRFGNWKKALLAAYRFSLTGEVPKDFVRARHRIWLSYRIRFLVLKRDLYQCRICKASGVKLEVDHIVPFSLGGSDDMENLQALCIPCNQGKRNTLQ